MNDNSKETGERAYLEPVEHSPRIKKLAFSRVLVGPGKDLAIVG